MPQSHFQSVLHLLPALGQSRTLQKTKMNIVHIFYNGDELHLMPGPQQDQWNNWPAATDSCRLFAIAAESWMRNGWTVKRLSANDAYGFDFIGQLKNTRYPLNRWALWMKLAQLPADAFPMVISTIDVINFGLNPVYLPLSSLGIRSLQWKPLSLACFTISGKAYAEHMVKLIEKYDRGELSPLPMNLVSDEAIFRHYGQGLGGQSMDELMHYWLGNQPGGYRFPLLHFARNLSRPVGDPAHFPVV